MKYQKQLFRHDPDNGVYGDCYRTAIACLLDLDPREVPHFCNRPLEELTDDGVKVEVLKWLKTLGLSYVCVAFDAELDAVFMAQKYNNPNTYYLITGTSATGCNHNVICLDDQIIWDPSLDNSGIVGPADDGYYWVEWLIPISQKVVA